MAELRSVARPKQVRSQKSMLRILDAAERLIAERGIAAVSVADIVREARSSVGGFYGRFRDKDELLTALLERLIRRLDARMAELERPEKFAGSSLVEIARPCIAELVAEYRARRPLFAALTARSAHNQGVRKLGRSFRTRVIERFASMLLQRRDEIRHPEPELAVELGVQMVFALMDQFVIYGEIRAGGEVFSDARVAREIERSLLGYLGATDR